MERWYTIYSKNKWISIYIWIVFCILPFYFIVRSFSYLYILIGVILILLYFLSYYFSSRAKNGLVYMWVSFEMALNIVMTIFYGYVYLSLFTAYFIGKIKSAVGFYIMYGLHIFFTVLSIVAGYFIDLQSFLAQTPFIIITVIGVVLLPFSLYSRNKRMNLEGELESAKERIAELVIHEERQRIARDLHDTLGQKLSMIGLKSDLASRLVKKDPDLAIKEIKEIRQTASIALKEVRELVSNMKTTKLNEEIERVKLMLQAAGIELEFIGDLNKLKVPILIENVLSMCLKEVVTNVVKHSEATKCQIYFEQNSVEVIMKIIDNGKGIGKMNFSGNGIKGIYERLDFINGNVSFENNNGTTVKITVPLAITHQGGGN